MTYKKKKIEGAFEMEVEALKGMNGDTISRTDAIDAVAYAQDGKDAQRILEDLPPAQPTEASCWGCNCPKIERSSAQPERPEQPESAREYCAECDHIEMCRWYPYEGCEFRSLPSAQPERPRGYMKIKVISAVDGEDLFCENCDAYCLSPSYNFCPKCGIEFIGVRGEQE